LAAIPKSIIQTSPGLTTGIVILHAVEHHRAIQSGLVAQFNILVGLRHGESGVALRLPSSFLENNHARHLGGFPA
jgi:hypothetical protein